MVRFLSQDCYQNHLWRKELCRRQFELGLHGLRCDATASSPLVTNSEWEQFVPHSFSTELALLTSLPLIHLFQVESLRPGRPLRFSTDLRLCARHGIEITLSNSACPTNKLPSSTCYTLVANRDNGRPTEYIVASFVMCKALSTFSGELIPASISSFRLLSYGDFDYTSLTCRHFRGRRYLKYCRTERYDMVVIYRADECLREEPMGGLIGVPLKARDGFVSGPIHHLRPDKPALFKNRSNL